MPWGAVAGALTGAVANKVLNKGSTGGASGNGPPAYIPKDQAGVDDNFLYNKNQYEATLGNQQAMLNPYANQLLQSQFNPDTLKAANDISGWAQNDYLRNAQHIEAMTPQAWQYANNQLANANQSNQLFQDGLGNVKGSVNGLYGLADESNKHYQGLIDYQKGQLGNIQNSQNNLYSGGNKVLDSAFDPQNALYNRTQQQLTEQTRAAQYARGIQSAPLGAAVESNALGNFNIDWQNQQLARQSQGLAAAQGAYGNAQGMGNSYTNTQAGLQAGKNEQYTNLTNAAQNQYTGYLGAMTQNNTANTQNYGASTQNAINVGNSSGQALQNALQAGYGTQQNIYGNQQQALQNYANLNSGYLSGLNQLQSNDLGYMNYGQGAQSQNFNQNAYNNQQNLNAIGQISGPLGNAVGNMFKPSGGSGNNPGNFFDLWSTPSSSSSIW